MPDICVVFHKQLEKFREQQNYVSGILFDQKYMTKIAVKFGKRSKNTDPMPAFTCSSYVVDQKIDLLINYSLSPF